MQKKLLNTAKKTVLLFASLHIIILIYLALATNNPTFINIFSILDLQEFYPGIEKGTASMIISGLIVASIFVFFYYKDKKN